MGLTKQSTGRGALDAGPVGFQHPPSAGVIALAGNPNVGKSTVFNALTGLRQHTGNWPGKTVASAQGRCGVGGEEYVLVDLPGCYSLLAHSAEEEVARDFICFGPGGGVAVVCDAGCLERSLILVLQTLEITSRVLVCVNFLDEARKKGLQLDLPLLSRRLGVPVLGTAARSGQGLDELRAAFSTLTEQGGERAAVFPLSYGESVEQAVGTLVPAVRAACGDGVDARWLALRLLDGDASLHTSLRRHFGRDIEQEAGVKEALAAVRSGLAARGLSPQALRDHIAARLVNTAEALCRDVARPTRGDANARDRRLDRVLTSRWAGYPLMFLLLALVFWLTITGANVPSQLLGGGLFWLEDRLYDLFLWAGGPTSLGDALIRGAYRVMAWVVSVMLPPMAIFFPLFTLLEDSGYLPRVAFNLDKCFQKCRACGKQALTMCMGFGCNAAGVTGCRIIDSPRERLIAILTNNFVPCNGRFPILISVITMFFVGGALVPFASVTSALLLAGVIVLGVGLTLLVSRVLSATVLQGLPSSFALELPPYRRPQVGRVVVRSLLDRTLFVLGRAVAAAAPTGFLIWLLANIFVGEASLLAHCAAFLDPFARLLGLDGVILIAFILGLPANEIVVPIIIMVYMSQGNLQGLTDLTALRQLLTANGWTWATAVSVLLFTLLHWPCSTTLLTIRKETGGWKWTALAFLLPTLTGMLLCFLFNGAVRLFT